MLCVCGIVAEVVDQVAPADVEHRADGDEGAEADHFLQAPVEDGGAERAALADEADVAGPRHGGGEGGVQARQRAHHAQAVGADEAHVAGRASSSICRSSSTPSGPISLKPAEMTMAPRTPSSPHSPMMPGNGGRRRDDHRQVHLLRECPRSLGRP